MGLLMELINVLDRQKIKHLEVMGSPGKKAGKLYELFNGFQTGTFATEEDAAMALYQAPPTDRRYRKLRNKLKTRLINTLMYIDPNQSRFTEYSLAQYNCLKLFTTQKIIDFYLGSRSSTKLIARVIKEADKYGFFYLALEATRDMRKRAIMGGDIKLMQESTTKIKYYQELIEAECLAEELYYSLAVTFSRSRQLRDEMFEEHLKKKELLIPFLEKHNTPVLTYFAYNYFSLIHMIGRDYHQALEECRTALDRLNTVKREVRKLWVFTISFRMLQCHFQLKNYRDGELVVKRCLELTETGSVYNHFISREMYLLLNLHTERYDHACDIYWDAISSPRYKNLGNHTKENWKIYGAFIQYLIEIGVINAEGNPLGGKTFRIGKFLNEVPTYSKDKRGLNIPILIIQILFLLHRRRFSDVIDRMEALNTYVYRYLKKDANFRSNCFVKMLLTLPQADFHRQGVIRKASKYYQKLLDEPLEVSGEASEVEIIPYERLWDLVLDSLEDKFQRPRKTG